MKTLNNDLSKNTLKHLYLLYGEETYLIRNYKSRLKQAIVGDDSMNYTYMEGKEIDYAEAKEAILAMPFFGDYRLIVLENSGIFKNASKDDWESVLNAIPETSYVVFVESAIDKRSRLYKQIGKIGYAAELSHPNAKSLEDWAGKSFQRANRAIDAEALSCFCEMCSDSMERMQLEIEKLCDYTLGKPVIELADVLQVTSPHIENRVFDMIEYVASGKEKEALSLYYDLATLHEEPMKIHALLAKHLNQLLAIKYMMEEGATKEKIAQRLKIHPYFVSKMMGQARSFDQKQLREYFELCVKSDEAIKTGNLNATLSVELLIVTIARRK